MCSAEICAVALTEDGYGGKLLELTGRKIVCKVDLAPVADLRITSAAPPSGT